MPRAFGYCRASTAEQLDSIDIQKERIQKEYDYRLKDDGIQWGGFFCDPGISGKIPLGSRGAGLRMLNELQRGDVVILARLDRGFRMLKDFAEQLDRWTADGVRLVLCSFSIDTGTPAGRMFVQILSIFAEFERAIIAERVAESLALRRHQKRPLNGKPPYGFKIVGAQGAKRLKYDWAERRDGSQIVAWVESGWTFEAVYLHLIRHKIKRKNGKAWSEGAIKRAYHGEMKLRLADPKNQVWTPEERAQRRRTKQEKQP